MYSMITIHNKYFFHYTHTQTPTPTLSLPSQSLNSSNKCNVVADAALLPARHSAPLKIEIKFNVF